MKTCNKCNQTKPETEFNSRKNRKGQAVLRNSCKKCHGAINALNKEKNKEKYNAAARLKYATDLEYKRRMLEAKAEYRKLKKPDKQYTRTPEQKEAARQSDKKYKASHKAEIRAAKAKRRSSELQRTPSYADFELIKKFYLLAKHLYDTTGIKYHVDHIDPLLGTTVSGFHIESNLQVIKEIDNLRKNNKQDYSIIGVCPVRWF